VWLRFTSSGEVKKKRLSVVGRSAGLHGMVATAPFLLSGDLGLCFPNGTSASLHNGAVQLAGNSDNEKRDNFLGGICHLKYFY
jgi:hypothetical protein